MSTPLWEFDHPYYCSEHNYFSDKHNLEYGSWESFVESEGDADFDMNLVFRWDWKPNDDLDDQTAEDRREYAARFGDRDHAWTLSIFWMGQRKGLFRSTDVQVCKANEPAVREWLTRRAEHMRIVWEPLLDHIALPAVVDVELPGVNADDIATLTAIANPESWRQHQATFNPTDEREDEETKP